MPQQQRRDRGGAATRARILEAAEQVVRERGLARATTKEIARAAGCSEAALYKHYKDKSDLVLAMITSRPGGLRQHLTDLPSVAARQSLEETLIGLAECAVDYFSHAMPLGNALFAEPDLLERYRRRMIELGVGPRRPMRMLAAFLRKEQAAGRVSESADPEAAAAFLLGACFYRSFLDTLLGEGAEEIPEFIRDTVSALLPVLEPGRTPDPQAA
jgi:AcrR family transcriptional regulator